MTVNASGELEIFQTAVATVVSEPTKVGVLVDTEEDYSGL